MHHACAPRACVRVQRLHMPMPYAMPGCGSGVRLLVSLTLEALPSALLLRLWCQVHRARRLAGWSPAVRWMWSTSVAGAPHGWPWLSHVQLWLSRLNTLSRSCCQLGGRRRRLVLPSHRPGMGPPATLLP